MEGIYFSNPPPIPNTNEEKLFNKNGEKIIPNRFYSGMGQELYFVFQTAIGLVAENIEGKRFLLSTKKPSSIQLEKSTGLIGVLDPFSFYQLSREDIERKIAKSKSIIEFFSKYSLSQP